LFAFVWQYIYFKPHGLVVALFACSWIVPIINTLYRHDRFAWETPRVFQGPSARDITRA
jgi:enediyne biosynthesis protein E5